jgi:lysophospholipase L1-like esterase
MCIRDSVCGVVDKVVPVDENTRLFASTIRELGGDITTIYKDEVGHHPHSLPNPTPIVDFILRATGHKINFAQIPVPGCEYRSAAGWKAGKGWWQQAGQIDSLCQVFGQVDLLLIGNSITQGWGGPRSWVTYKPGQKAADINFNGMTWLGAGISGDRVQHVAWRLTNGHYKECNPRFVVLTIGVNNFREANAAEIVDGLSDLLKLTEATFPHARILFCGPLPAGLTPDSEWRREYREIHRVLNEWNYSENVSYFDLEDLFSDEEGNLKNSLYSRDGIHLQPEGYEVWAKFIREQVDELAQ